MFFTLKIKKKNKLSPVVQVHHPAHGRLRQEVGKAFKASVGFLVNTNTIEVQSKILAQIQTNNQN